MERLFVLLFTQSCWKGAAQVYLQVLEMQQTRVLQSVLDAVNSQLDALVNALKLLGRVFPVAGASVPSLPSPPRVLPFLSLCTAHDAQKAESERTMRLSSLALFVSS